jgi:hypothetical protein
VEIGVKSGTESDQEVGEGTGKVDTEQMGLWSRLIDSVTELDTEGEPFEGETNKVDKEDGEEVTLLVAKGSMSVRESWFKFWKGRMIFMTTFWPNLESFLDSFCEEMVNIN